MVSATGSPISARQFLVDAADKATEGTKGSLWLNQLGLARSTNRLLLGSAASGSAWINQHWQVHLNPQTSTDLADHALLKHPVFAAAGYLALLLDWRQQCQQPLSLGRVELDRPFGSRMVRCSCKLFWTVNG